MAFFPAAPAVTALPTTTSAAACRRRPPRTGRGSLAVAAAAAGQYFGGATAAAAAAASAAVVGVVAPLSPHVVPCCFGGSTAGPPRGSGSGNGIGNTSSRKSSSSSSSTTGGGGGGAAGGGGGSGGGGDDEGEDEAERVIVRDVVTGRSLPAVVTHTVVARGTSYAVCAPRDEPVVIATMTVEDGEDVLAPIDDEATLDALFPTAYSVMAENDWTLHRTAFVLTAEDLADDDDDDDEEEEEDKAVEPATGDHTMAEAAAVAATGDEDDEEVVEGSEEVQVLAEFCVDSVRYYVCTPCDPVVLVARTAQGAGGDGILVVPDEAELAAVTPVIEDALEAQAELL